VLLFRYALRSLLARTRANLLTVFAVCLLVIGGSGGLAFHQGLRDKLVDTTPPQNELVLSKGALGEIGSMIPVEAANKLVLLDGVSREGNAPVATRELVTRIHISPETGEFRPMTFRGYDERSLAIHKVTVAEGAMPAAGTLDIALGKRVANEFKLKIGDSIPLIAGTGKVTGILTANGAQAEDEVWTPRPALEAMLNFKMSSSVTLVAENAAKAVELVEKINTNKDLNLQAAQVLKLRSDDARVGTVSRVVLIMLVLLGVVATFAIATTMTAATLARMPELAALAALGIRRGVLGRVVLVESLLLAGVGALVGVLLGSLIRTQLGLIVFGNNPVELSGGVSAPVIGVAIGVVVGVLGGFVPSMMVRRLDIVRQMR
jgi:ABC-type lipoprotein release transport system permease subunit